MTRRQLQAMIVSPGRATSATGFPFAFSPQFRLILVPYHSASSSIVKWLMRSHSIPSHNTHTLSLSLGLARSQPLLSSPLCDSSVPFGNADHIGRHLSLNSPSVDFPSSL